MRAPSLNELPPPPPGKRGWPWTVGSPQVADSMPDGQRWPRVSVVTPSYNQAEFLEETIRSVLLQGYPNLEYIIIDGGSTDSSVAIIRRYAGWLAHWESAPDRGQSHAINKGWGRATGDILCWLNSDDFYFAGAIAQAATALSSNSTAAAVYSNCRYIDGHGSPLVERTPGETSFGRLLEGLVGHIPQPTTFVRRSALSAVGLLDGNLDYSMDYDLWLRISMRNPLHYVDALWAATRMHKDAKTVARQRQCSCLLATPSFSTVCGRGFASYASWAWRIPRRFSFPASQQLWLRCGRPYPRAYPRQRCPLSRP